MREAHRQEQARRTDPRVRAEMPEVFPKDLQQQCLNIFKSVLWRSPDDLEVIQAVKGHLFNRDFGKAFGQQDYLQAYALRWSASRALAYAVIFQKIQKHLRGSLQSLDTPLNVMSIGGGAGAELGGMALWLASLQGNDGESVKLQASLHSIDIAKWDEVFNKLYTGVVTPPQLSEYASAAAKQKNKALLPGETLASSFTCADVLQWDNANSQTVLAGVHLITIMFTLNELYTISMAQTQRLLRVLTTCATPGILLLVVDSPGSYSTVSINGAEKKYPMQWLLDHTLLGVSKDKPEPAWTKVISEDSEWFRLPDGLEYPVQLENMRYQIHLYQRSSNG